MSWSGASTPGPASRALSGAWLAPRRPWRSRSNSPPPSAKRSSSGPSSTTSARSGLQAILRKPAALDLDERRVIEQHPGTGSEILEAVPLLTPALDVVGAHHERWDGSGYPHGLRDEAIPLTARIFAVVDALDAMTHDRP